ncbi:hypothetical protein V8D89_011989 [Ganoderma adspersum]
MKTVVSDSDVGDNPADVKTSNSASEKDAEDAVAMHTPSKRNPKARPQDHEEEDVPAPVKCGRGRPPKVKAVKSPELVPSEEDEPATPKGRSSTKPLKTGMKKNYAEEEVSVEDTPQKTPKKRIGHIKSTIKTNVQAPWSIDSEADARRPDTRPTVQTDRTLRDNVDVDSPESPSLRKVSTPYRSNTKASSQKCPANIESSEEEIGSDSEQEHPSPSKKPHQCSLELEYHPMPKTLKSSNAGILGFGKAQVVITAKPTRLATAKATPITKKGGKDNSSNVSHNAAKPSKAPDSASDFFTKSPVKAPKKGRSLFVDDESLDDTAESGKELESDPSVMCIDSDTERPESPPPVYISADKDTTVVSSKKGKKPRAPTLYSDSEDTTATGQLNDMSLQTPQKAKPANNCYPPIEDIIDIAAHLNMNKCLSYLKDVVVNYTDNRAFWTGDIHKTVLNVSAYKMHPAGLLYAVGLMGNLKDGVINPARWDPSNATSIYGNSNRSLRVLAVDSQSGLRHAVVATFGTVLQSDIIESTPLYIGSTQKVLQVILAPFKHEWTRIQWFYGTVFDKYNFILSIYGARIMGGNEQDRMHSLQIRSWPSEKTSSAPQAVTISTSGFVVSHAGGSSQSEARQDSKSGSAASPDQSFYAMSLQSAWPVMTPIPIWDAHPQFASGKYLCDGIFTIEDTFKLPRLKGKDLQHRDITLIYHSITMYPKDNTGAMGLSFGLYGAVLMGRPT